MRSPQGRAFTTKASRGEVSPQELVEVRGVDDPEVFPPGLRAAARSRQRYGRLDEETAHARITGVARWAAPPEANLEAQERRQDVSYVRIIGTACFTKEACLPEI